jgi:hypothetical protein
VIAPPRPVIATAPLTCPTVAPPQPGGEAERHEHEHRRVAESHVGREADARLDDSREHARLELRQRALERAVVRDQGRHAVVGGAQHRPPGLQRAHPADVEVLVGRGGITEPGVVGDVDEQRRAACERELLRGVGVLVADGRREQLAAGRERRLLARARHEVGVRQVHQPQPLAHRRGHREELPEGHEASLVVPLLRRAERDHRVVESAGGPIPTEQPHDDVGPLRTSRRMQALEVVADVALERRQRGLGPDDDAGPEVRDRQLGVEIQGAIALARFPLHRLWHRTLHQRHADVRAAYLGPADAPEQRARDPDGRNGHDRGDPRRPTAEQQRDEGAGDQGHREARAVDAHERREARQRRVELRVPEREPRKTAQEPAAEPLDGHPAGRQQQQPSRRARRGAPARHGVAERRGIAAHDRDQPEHQECRDPQRRAAHEVDAVVEPVGPGQERPAGKEEAAPGGAARRGALPEQEQHRRAQEGQRHQRGRRERECERGARGRREPLPAPGEEVG